MSDPIFALEARPRMSVLRGILTALAAWALFASAASAQELLEPDKAFRFSARALDPSALEITYRIAPGYYLYRKNFKFELTEPAGAALGEPQFPPGHMKKDPIFGETEIFRDEVKIRAPVALPAGAKEVTLLAGSQGCSDIGVCYVPETRMLKVAMDDSAGGASALSPLLGRSQAAASYSTPNASSVAPEALLGAAADPGGAARLFASGSLWLIAAGFFGFGLLLAFTPCILPMIPILSGIVVGDGARSSKARALLLSSIYVLGMAMTYALLGIAAGLSGTLLTTTLQNPWVLGAFAALFALLALSMFGFYELRLPHSWQAWLSGVSSRVPGGRTVGALIMGVLSALLVGPCIAAPLAGALLYISQTHDIMLGGTALFSLALGMGAPLIAVGASAGTLLPKAGPWMLTVQRFFGVVLLALAIWIVSPVVPLAVHMALWGLLLIMCAVYLRALDPLPAEASGFDRFAKGAGVVALLVGAALLAGALAGARDLLQPLGAFRAGSRSGESSAVPFERIKTVVELDARVAAAAGQGRAVMLDFYADWCVTCKEMERFTFSDDRIRRKMSQIVLLQADVTRNTAEDAALLKRFGLFGPPGIVFFDGGGRQLPARVIGYQGPDEFLATLDGLGPL